MPSDKYKVQGIRNAISRPPAYGQQQQQQQQRLL